MNIKELALNAKKASKSLASIGTKKKNELLEAICIELEANTDIILSENKKDIEEAENLSETIEVLENNKHILEKEACQYQTIYYLHLWNK